MKRKVRHPPPTIQEAVERVRQGKCFWASLTEEQRKIALSAPEEAERFGPEEDE